MIGQTISHYKILEKLGEGGMGIVYRAEDTRLKRCVALKFISPQSLESEEEKTRFVREAQSAAGLSHPNITTIHEIEEANDKMFIAMEYVEGQNLKEIIKAGPLKTGEALDIALQVAEGLQEAHEKGIVHRDIKSPNIMITEKGRAKIMDFGLAKLRDERTQLTQTAVIMGTVSYMSPEQACGRPADARSDIWSLGVVLYEMLGGKLPFRGEHDQVILYSILTEKPQSLKGFRPEIPAGLQRIVNKCLEKDPDRRYQTAAALKADLLRLKNDVIMEESAGTKRDSSAFLRRRKIRSTVALVLAGTALVMLALFSFPESRGFLSKLLGFKRLPTEKYLAVLPFTVVSNDPEDQAFCTGITEFLTSRLTQLEHLHRAFWVAPMSEVRKSGVQSPSEARKTLGVTLALTASIHRLGEKILVTLNLVDTDRLHQLKSIDMEIDTGNTYALHTRIVNSAVQMLEVTVPPKKRRSLASGGSEVPGAFEPYVRGLGYLQRYESEESLNMAISLFEQALAVDPSFALAHAALGEAYWRKFKLTNKTELVESAQSHARLGLELEKNLAPTHITLGLIYRDKGEYEDAVKEFEQALQLDPLSSDAYRELAFAFEKMGKIKEAEETYARAIALKPYYWSGYSHLGVFYLFRGRYEEAEKMFIKVTELTPNNSRGYDLLGSLYFHMGRREPARAMYEKSIDIMPSSSACSNLGTIYLYEGRFQEAMAMYEKAIQMEMNNWTIQGNLATSYRYVYGQSEMTRDAYLRAVQLAEKQLDINPKDAELNAQLARYYALLGDKKRAQSIISLARKLDPSHIQVLLLSVQVFELIDRREDALAALRELIEAGGSLEFVQKDPDLSGLRHDPRCQRLLEKMKSPEMETER